jgi:hypothetical protein
VPARYPDGSYLSTLDRLRVRVIDCEITITTTTITGRRTSLYRPATTPTDPHHYPAAELIELYHQRREFETAYLEPTPASWPAGCHAPAPHRCRTGDLRPPLVTEHLGTAIRDQVHDCADAPPAAPRFA